MREELKKGVDIESSGDYGFTPLICAASKGRVAAARFLIEQKAVVDKATQFGVTPLHIAANQGNIEVLSLLLDHGAELNRRTRAGECALHLALQNPQPQSVKFLLERKADATLVSTASRWAGTPLHEIARQKGMDECASLLGFATTAAPPPAPPAPRIGFDFRLEPTDTAAAPAVDSATV